MSPFAEKAFMTPQNKTSSKRSLIPIRKFTTPGLPTQDERQFAAGHTPHPKKASPLAPVKSLPHAPPATLE